TGTARPRRRPARAARRPPELPRTPLLDGQADRSGLPARRVPAPLDARPTPNRGVGRPIFAFRHGNGMRGWGSCWVKGTSPVSGSGGLAMADTPNASGYTQTAAPGVGPVVCLCYLAGRSPEEAAEELRADGLGEYDAAVVRELYRK